MIRINKKTNEQNNKRRSETIFLDLAEVQKNENDTIKDEKALKGVQVIEEAIPIEAEQHIKFS